MATRIMFQRREAALVEHRQAARHRIECMRVTAQGDEEVPFPALLSDISTFGCRLHEIGDADLGERLWIRLPGSSPVLAQVAWTKDNQAGCRFAAPISQGLMRSLLAGSN